MFILKTISARLLGKISEFVNTRMLFVAFAKYKYCVCLQIHHNALFYMWVTLLAGKLFHIF